MSKKQALTGVAFTGVTRLNEASDFGASLGIPEVIYLKWLGLTAKVAQRNKEVSAACVELVKQYAHDGLACCVHLKIRAASTLLLRILMIVGLIMRNIMATGL